MVNQDTPEPSDDGYVSRNVYDYDEPEPPADVREALARAIDECPAWRICGYDQQDETPTIREREMVLDAIMPVLEARDA